MPEDISEKTKKVQQRLRDVGYFASEHLSKMVRLFESAGKKDRKSIPSLYLEGASGAGKTFLGESFAKMIGAEHKFVQCFPRMGTENFYKDIDADTMIDKQVNGGANAEIIAKALEFYAKCIGKEEEFYKIFDIDKNKLIKQEDLKDNRQVVQLGILLQALEASKTGPVVVTIDELDKSRPEVDYFLLDFFENGRITTGTEEFYKGQYPIYVVITSNGVRKIDKALINRSRKVEVPRPEKELFLEILGLPENDPLAYVYDKCQGFSIRQAKEYLMDLEELEVKYDEDALSQYINIDDLEVRSLEDIERLSKINNDDFDIELPNLDRCYITLNPDNEEGWMKIYKDGNKGKFRLYSDDEQKGKMYVDIDTIEQLQIASEYMDFDDYSNRYKGWFEYSLSDEEIESDNIIWWAVNKDKEDGTRFGIKTDRDTPFKIAMNRGSTFVYLDSQFPNTLEQFLGQQKGEIEQEYETDSEYVNSGRDYDD